MGKQGYVARYERDAEGWWTVTIPGTPGGVHCVSQGRSLQQARARIREALAACLDDEKAAEEAEIEERIALSTKVRGLLRRVVGKRERAERLRAEASEDTRAAARMLAEEGLSVRDAAELLGISFQRVQQLLDETKEPRLVRAAKRRPE